MDKPMRTLPSNYISSGSVSLKKRADLTAMLIWSVVLLVLSLFLVRVILSIPASRQDSPAFGFSINSLIDLLIGLGGILLVTVVMVVVHEGLHGLVFWRITRERPKFAFKWYYASASAGDWYLPRLPYLAATLLPLIAITAVSPPLA